MHQKHFSDEKNFVKWINDFIRFTFFGRFGL